jgi:hypothetical protein
MRKSKERHRLENIGVDWKILLKWMLKKYDVNFLIWVHGTKERAVVNTVLDVRVPENEESF